MNNHNRINSNMPFNQKYQQPMNPNMHYYNSYEPSMNQMGYFAYNPSYVSSFPISPLSDTYNGPYQRRYVAANHPNMAYYEHSDHQLRIQRDRSHYHWPVSRHKQIEKLVCPQ